MESTDPCVLVEGPAWGDAHFLGEWLLAAAKAEAFWKEAHEDRDFEKQIRGVWCCIPDFGMAAIEMIMRLRQHRTSFVLEVNSELGEEFTMMATMGFFIRNDQSCEMTLPARLTSGKMRSAMLALTPLRRKLDFKADIARQTASYVSGPGQREGAYQPRTACCSRTCKSFRKTNFSSGPA
jgi:hypothetical protein